MFFTTISLIKKNITNFTINKINEECFLSIDNYKHNKEILYFLLIITLIDEEYYFVLPHNKHNKQRLVLHYNKQSLHLNKHVKDILQCNNQITNIIIFLHNMLNKDLSFIIINKINTSINMINKYDSHFLIPIRI